MSHFQCDSKSSKAKLQTQVHDTIRMCGSLIQGGSDGRPLELRKLFPLTHCFAPRTIFPCFAVLIFTYFWAYSWGQAHSIKLVSHPLQRERRCGSEKELVEILTFYPMSRGGVFCLRLSASWRQRRVSWKHKDSTVVMTTHFFATTARCDFLERFANIRMKHRQF